MTIRKMLRSFSCFVFLAASCLILLSSSNAVLAADDNKPTLFIVGDSTVKNSTKGQQGWGDPLIKLFDPAKIKVENHAIGGRSSRTFQNEGRWDRILAAARAGDFVLVQMGHNDGGSLDDPQRARSLFRWSILYLFGICLLLMLARLPAGDRFSSQGLDLLQLAGAGAPAFTLAAPAAVAPF